MDREDARSSCFQPTGSTRTERLIPTAPAAEREAIARLVQKCLEAKGVRCKELEADIDGRVAELYGL